MGMYVERFKQQQPDIALFGGLHLTDLIAVSYTHLDVYKRQLQSRVKKAFRIVNLYVYIMYIAVVKKSFLIRRMSRSSAYPQFFPIHKYRRDDHGGYGSDDTYPVDGLAI